MEWTENVSQLMSLRRMVLWSKRVKRVMIHLETARKGTQFLLMYLLRIVLWREQPLLRVGFEGTLIIHRQAHSSDFGRCG